MTRLARLRLAATVIVVGAAVPAAGDPINIVSGSVFIPSGLANGNVILAGTRGFSLTGSVAASAGQTGLFGQCLVPECPPGASIGFNLDLTGASGFLGGVMTIEGDHYEISDSVTSMADVFLHFDGSIVAPEMGPPRPTVSGAFSLTGRAFALTPLGEFAHDSPLSGRGLATVTLVPYPPAAGFPPSWMVESARFDFLEPTPEPSTLLLLGAGGLFAVRMRRPRRSRVPQV